MGLNYLSESSVRDSLFGYLLPPANDVRSGTAKMADFGLSGIAKNKAGLHGWF